MAINLDRNLLEELGLGSLPENEKDSLLSHIYETLEMRVGMRLADQMTNEQLDEFEKYFEAKDDQGAFHWLETNFPNYKAIVQEEFDKLKNEVKQSVPQILQTANQNLAQAEVGSASVGPQVTPTLPNNSSGYAPQPTDQQPSFDSIPQEGPQQVQPPLNPPYQPPTPPQTP
jgi:hypothetical protein